MSQTSKPTILLIEADIFLRRLMVLGLQDRGIHVIDASSPATVPPLDPEQIDLLILDADQGTSLKCLPKEAASLSARFSSVPMITLSWDGQPVSVPAKVSTQVASLPKPFDARVLYKLVGQLLERQKAREAAQEAEAEKALLAAYSARTTLSIWPIMTAAGLLIAMIGMMFHLAIVVLGLLVVMIALLLWTLGSTESRPERIAVS